MRLNNILEGIGKTPVLRLNKIFDTNAEVWIKLEKDNPAGSIKDRIAFSMIEDAEKKGILKPDSIVVEPTSGNTGIGLAMVCAVKGYRLILIMPESMSVERRNLMAAFGADFKLTPRELGMKGAIDKAEEIAENNPKAWIPSQFDNKANVEIHRNATAQEVLEDFPQGIDYLITGVGTGGHISGVAEILKEKFPTVKVFAVEPSESPVISGGEPAGHPLQGIGAGFIPDNLHTDVLDGTITVSNEEAFQYATKVVRTEGLLAGISTGAALAAVAKKLPEIPDGATVLTFNYDTGERYLSVDGMF